MDSSDLCVAHGYPQPVPRTSQPVSRMPQLPPSFNIASHTAKMFFFLAASKLKTKKLNAFQEDHQFLKCCNVKGVVSHVTCENVLKAFSLEPHFVST